MNDALLNFKVTDRQSFIKFIDFLRQDFLDNPQTWQNKNLDAFLDAFSSYAADIQGYYDNNKLDINGNQPSWQTFTDIFKGAKFYE